ncbi:hypothetical protein ACFWY9_44210 [Amycolatopsis sp. NPDC059027]|uniref:hypothetical protein n=1 Tax=unclassified Amycolatopsis TaxID=2618356 RepID=UPI00367103CD
MQERSLRTAAFGGDPLPAGPVVVPPSATPVARLLAAIVLGARGRYAAAATLLAGLGKEPSPLIASLAGSTLASHRRQLGGHVRARALDGEAYALAIALPDTGRDPDGLDVAGARADALLGLAADNLALGRLAAARRLLALATAEEAGWRATVRSGWVGAEIELAAGRAGEAVAPARHALEAARERGARRHEIKSGIVLGVALMAAGDPGERDNARDLLENALAATEKSELYSLSWVVAGVMADLGAGHAEKYRFRAAEVLHAVLRHADPCGRRIARESPWVPP